MRVESHLDMHEQVVAGDDDGDVLPLVYDPVKIAEFWSRRPVAVTTRIVQLLSIAGGFLGGFLWDLANGKLAETEVGAALVQLLSFFL